MRRSWPAFSPCTPLGIDLVRGGFDADDRAVRLRLKHGGFEDEGVRGANGIEPLGSRHFCARTISRRQEAPAAGHVTAATGRGSRPRTRRRRGEDSSAGRGGSLGLAWREVLLGIEAEPPGQEPLATEHFVDSSNAPGESVPGVEESGIGVRKLVTGGEGGPRPSEAPRRPDPEHRQGGRRLCRSDRPLAQEPAGTKANSGASRRGGGRPRSRRRSRCRGRPRRRDRCRPGPEPLRGSRSG